MRRPSTIANRLFRHFFRSVWALVRPAPGGFSEKNAAGQKVVRMLSVDARRPAPCSCAPTRLSVPPTVAPTVTGPKSIFGLKTHVHCPTRPRTRTSCELETAGYSTRSRAAVFDYGPLWRATTGGMGAGAMIMTSVLRAGWFCRIGSGGVAGGR